jgi:hypothetical protein
MGLFLSEGSTPFCNTEKTVRASHNSCRCSPTTPTAKDLGASPSRRKMDFGDDAPGVSIRRDLISL